MADRNFFHSLLRSVALTICTVVVLIVLIGGGVYFATNRGPDIKDGSWLVLDLYGDVHEYNPPGDPVSQVMSGDALTLQDMLDNLGKAAVDKRIAGVIIQMSGNNGAGRAKLYELRRAVDKVQAAGKPVYAYADDLNLRALYLAAGCDKIYMPEGGYLLIKGFMAQSVHVRSALDKLGIVPHLHKIKDYKSAAEAVMDTTWSDAAREMYTWIVEDVWDQIVPVIAAERGMTEDRLLEHMAYADFLPVEAVEAGLIDEVLYWQDLEARLKKEDEDRLRMVSHGDYTDVSWEDVGRKGDKIVAVVHAQGNIGGRRNRIDPLMGIMMGHETITAELRRCRLDDDIEAVVFRVDSGGGESLARDLIAHEIEVLAQVKPVVVSMVDVAGSGGYYIAYKATKMMADPMTITGSIGSIDGFFNMYGFYHKLGITKDFLGKGPMAGYKSDYREPTEAEWARHSDAHWKGFNAWLADVAEKRGMAFEHAETLAHGRIFTGRQAVKNGLIDALGNLDDAVALAAQLAQIAAPDKVKVVHYPEKQDLLKSLLSDDDSADPTAALIRSALIGELRGQVIQSADQTLRLLDSRSERLEIE